MRVDKLISLLQTVPPDTKIILRDDSNSVGFLLKQNRIRLDGIKYIGENGKVDRGYGIAINVRNLPNIVEDIEETNNKPS